jgi:outer membrane protein OmpA-like peptidoglycan-associated protein
MLKSAQPVLSRLVVFLWLASGCTVAHAAQDPALSAFAAEIEKARNEQVDALAPSGFSEAVGSYQTAMKDAERSRNPQRVTTRVTEGRAILQKATIAASSVREQFAAVVKAREDAIAAQAPKLAGETWQRAAQRFNDAVIANERGNARNAQRFTAEAAVLMREAELIAIKGTVLNEARALIAQADAAKIPKFAPRSLQTAKKHLAEAEQEIQRNRYDLGIPRDLAAQSRYEARHALYLAQLVQKVRQEEDDDQAGIEALILSWEEPLTRIAKEMDFTPQYDAGMQQPMQDMLKYTQQLRNEREALKQELDHSNEQIASLNKELQQSESRLGGVSEERVALQRRVDSQERLRMDIAKVESSFSRDEARVVRQGEDLVISLLGIRFPSGRSTIDTASAPLMLKVSAALGLFPDASIVVEGHTDANGSDSTNLILSQDRADAVKQYLVSNFRVNPEKVSSIGYGEARPVATNDTPEGRARNRRIDVILNVGGMR